MDIDYIEELVLKLLFKFIQIGYRTLNLLTIIVKHIKHEARISIESF